MFFFGCFFQWFGLKWSLQSFTCKNDIKSSTLRIQCRVTVSSKINRNGNFGRFFREREKFNTNRRSFSWDFPPWFYLYDMFSYTIKHCYIVKFHSHSFFLFQSINRLNCLAHIDVIELLWFSLSIDLFLSLSFPLLIYHLVKVVNLRCRW